MKLREDQHDRYSQAGTYHNLGIVAEELRQYEQARSQSVGCIRAAMHRRKALCRRSQGSLGHSPCATQHPRQILGISAQVD
ncbi:MAG: hypothetical protein ACFCVD_20335 [Nodosilinea sp.]